MNKNSKDYTLVDHKNILTGLAMKKYVNDETGDNLRLCMQLIKPESKQHYTSSNAPQNQITEDQIVIVEDVKMSLLAKSCYAPGIIALISNLIMSTGDAEDDGDGSEDDPSLWSQ